MRVALIGGTGFIGHHVTQWLVKAGADVSAIHRGDTPVRAPGVRSLRADRGHAAALATALSAATPDVVVDMTAYTADDVKGLLAALPDSLVRLVIISSGDVYWTYGAFLGLVASRTIAAPLDEQASLREQLYPYRAQAIGPTDRLYGYDKIMVERTAQSAGVPVTILRLPMVYGPDDPQRRVAGYVERFQSSGGTLRLNAAEAAWRCTRGYVEDVAWAIRLATMDEGAAGEIFNVGEEEGLTELEWVRAIASAAGWSGQVTSDVAIPPSLPAEWGMPLLVDTHRIREVLGYQEPIGREEGLRRATAAVQHQRSPHGVA